MSTSRFSKSLTSVSANNIVTLLDLPQELAYYEQFKADNIVDHSIVLEDLQCKVGLFSLLEADWPDVNALASESAMEAARAKILKEGQKIYLELYIAKGNGPWELQGEEILQNKNGLEQPWALMAPWFSTNETALLGEDLRIGVRVANKAQGTGGLKGSDYLRIFGTWRKQTRIELKKKDDGVEALNDRISALETLLNVYGAPSANLPGTNGLVPAPPAGGGEFLLRGDRNWENPNKFATPTDIEQAIIDWVGTAPTNLDTLIELSAALGNDPNFVATVLSQLALKANLANPVFTGSVTSPVFNSNETGRFENSSAVFERRLLAFNLYPSSTASQGYRYQQAGFGFVVEQLTTGQIRIKFTPAAGVAGAMASLANSIIIDLNETITLSKGLNVTGGVLSTNGQIQFPATKNLSTNGRILDDYEEGTFTPTIHGTMVAGVGTYTSQSGTFNKIGRIVFFALFAEYTAHTGTGDMRITGLPYMPNFADVLVNCSWSRNLSFTAGNSLISYIIPNTNAVMLGQLPSGGGMLAGVPMDTAAGIMVSGFYFTAS